MKTFAKRSIGFSLFLLIWWAGIAAAGTPLVRATLDNGLQVVIVRNSLAPVVTTMVNYLVGADECPPGFPGTAHALEHMMFRGSAGLTADQLSSLIAAMGGQFNADTQQSVTQYFFSVPVDDLETALRVEAIRMRDVLASEDLWEQERGAIEQEVAQDLSNPMYLFYQRLLADIFKGTPYAHDALGTRPSFQKTTGADLKAFHSAWYAPNNAILVIVGDVDPESALSMVKELFKDIPSRPLPERTPIALGPPQASTVELETDLGYGLCLVAYRFPGYRSPDFAAGQTLADALASERAGLYGLVPQGNALEAGFSVDFLPEAGLCYAYAAFPRGADGRQLAETLKRIIAGYLEKGVPPELVEAAKRKEVADVEFSKTSIEDLADLWSQTLAVEGRRSPEDDIEAIKRVTAADVDRVARKYLINDTAIVGILRPQSSGGAKASSMSRGKESFAPREVEPAALPEWGKQVLNPRPIPVSNVNPTMITLPNGLRLIVQRETVSPTVTVYGQVKHNEDLQTPKGKEGVDDTLDSLFSYGTTTLDRLAFQAAVDEIAADISVGASFDLQVLSSHFERGMELLADNLLRPALPEEAFKVVKQETKDVVAGQLQSPRYLSRRALIKALYPEGDPARRFPTPESVESLSLKDVKDYYQAVFRPDLTVIAIIGDVTVDQARGVVEKYFGGWKAEGPKPQTDLPPVPPNKASQVVVPDKTRVQDVALMAQNLELTRSDPDYYPLQTGNHILCGAFYSSRLFRDLREKTGLVYTVMSEVEADKTRAKFLVYYACDPENVSKAGAIVKKNIREMGERPVTQDELRLAKTLLVKAIPLSESSESDVADKLVELTLLDLPLDEPVRAAKRYVEITPEQIQAAFAKWTRPEGFAEVVLGPEPR